ncbi:MAG: zinc-ribbon domain-containing protein [Oscillibacter sp.]|nr:zinc-ribbon domain-containing protein [Oscillibacter sp.]
MANCTHCGAPLQGGSRFCTECGATIPAAETVNHTPPPPPAQPAYTPPPPQAAPAYTQAPQQPAYPQSSAGVPLPGGKYELISTKGLIGIMLLMCIPVVGQILMIVWALGGCRKIQKRNLARASLIMMVVALVISFILGLVLKSLFGKVVDKIEAETGISISEMTGSEKGKNGDSKGSGADGLLGLIGTLSGGEGSTGNEELDELKNLMNDLEAITGEENNFDDLVDEVDKVNQEAEKHSDGWPSDLPDFPGGTMNSTASYRTEFAGTTLEDTVAYIETLKASGYEYQDFYDFGMSEADMMEFGGWWGYNGKWYISISYSEGTTLIDHVTELPDLSSILG